MKKLLHTLTGTVTGACIGGYLVVIGDLISGTAMGITLTLLACIVLGTIVNGFSGLCAGLVSGLVVVLYSHMFSQTALGVGCTLVSSAFIGGVIAWELSQQSNARYSVVRTRCESLTFSNLLKAGQRQEPEEVSIPPTVVTESVYDVLQATFLGRSRTT